MIVLLDAGITIDTAVVLGLIAAVAGTLVTAVSVLYKALSAAYDKQLDDMRAQRDKAQELTELALLQLGKSTDVTTRTVNLAERRAQK